MDTSRLLSPEEIASRAPDEAPHFAFPDLRSLFADRETRLRELAAGHSLRDFLLFVAAISHAQHIVANASPVSAASTPSESAFRDCARSAMAPLSLRAWPRPREWQKVLQAMCSELLSTLPQSAAKNVVQKVFESSPADLDLQADRLTEGITVGLDLASAPIIAAALQVFYARAVAHAQSVYGSTAFGPITGSNRCPCCESLPSVSAVRQGAVETGARYLHCSLCQTQWHLVRIKCANCFGTQGIHYESLAASHSGDSRLAEKNAVKAECCEACGHYLKILYAERDLRVEPVADDIATTTLDLLVAESSCQRFGVNLLLLYGNDQDAEVNAL